MQNFHDALVIMQAERQLVGHRVCQLGANTLRCVLCDLCFVLEYCHKVHSGRKQEVITVGE